VLRLIPIVQVDTPCVKVAKIVNAQIWRGTATFSLDDGSSIITEPASWGSSQSFEMRQIAAQITVDGAAARLASSDYDVLAEQASVVAEMLAQVALGRQAWTKSPDPNGYTNFFDLATGMSRVADPPAGVDSPIDYSVVRALINMLGRNVTRRSANVLVMALEQYDDFRDLLYSTGNAQLLPCADGDMRLHYDGMPICPEENLASGNIALVQVMQPRSLAQGYSARAGAGAAFMTNRAPGPVVEYYERHDKSDQLQFVVNWNVGLLAPGSPVAWIENVGAAP
jgi:hypothetical protein